MKIYVALLTALSSIIFSGGAIADNQPLACQSDEVGGLAWENGRWGLHSFIPQKFILVQSTNGLTQESVSKLFTSSANCRTVFQKRVSCSSDFGRSLFFDPATLKGGYSLMFGGIQADNVPDKDTMVVIAFSCTPF